MLLDAAGEEGPYVLVGHSFGGFIVRVFTGQYPKDVSGVVLVDPSHQDEEELILKSLSPAQKQRATSQMEREEKLEQILGPLELHLGVRRLAVAFGWETPNHLPKRLQEELLYLDEQQKQRDSVEEEGAAYPESVAEIRAAGSLGDRPLIVVTAGRPYQDEPFLGDEQRKLWIDVLQAEEARLSTRGKQTVVDSGHMIPFERPDALVSPIHEVWLAARSGAAHGQLP